MDRSWTVLAGMLCACEPVGGVHLVVRAPSDSAMSPFDGRLSSLRLLIDGDGVPLQTITSSVDEGADIRFGDVPVSDRARIRLDGRSTSGALVGFGRADGLVSISPTETITVEIPFRRPFVYVAGADALLVLDPTRTVGESYLRSVDIGLPPVGVATSPTGKELAIVGNSLTARVWSESHLLEENPSMGGGTDVAFSPDEHWLVTANGGRVALADLQSGQGATVDVGGVATAVVAGRERAFALVADPERKSCASRLVAVGLAQGKVTATLDLPGCATDLGFDDGASWLVVAMPLAGLIRVPVPFGESFPVTLDILYPTVVAIHDGWLTVAGTTQKENGAQLVIGRVGLDGNDGHVFMLPIPTLHAVFLSEDQPGQANEVVISADAVVPIDLAIFPDGQQFVVATQLNYESEPTRASGLVVIPGLTAVTHELVVVDVAAGTIDRRLRTDCNLSKQGTSLLDAIPGSFQCGLSPDERASELRFVPTKVAALYGAR